MCGILGIYSHSGFDGEAFVGRELAGLTHRGPDASGIFSDTSLTLGHRRLSILDLKDSSNQPFSDPSRRKFLVYNGELYNYHTLSKSLQAKGFRPQTSGDTEILFQYLNRHGIEGLRHLDGMFAFAFYDTETKRLLLVRDPVGIKPLYYTKTENGLAFSSELRPLIAFRRLSESPAINLSAEWLHFQCHIGQETPIKGIYTLPAGHFALYDGTTFSIKAYKNPRELFETTGTTSREELREKLLLAVQKRLMSEVPLGTFLSGGVDSSTLVALMRQVHSGELRTFTVGFETRSEFDERHIAKEVAKVFGTKHSELELSQQEALALVPQAVAAMDNPSADAINSYLVSKMVKQAGITVALSGLGGDEWFSGYPSFSTYYKRARFSSRISSMVAHVFNLLPGHESIRRHKLIHLLASPVHPRLTVALQRQLFNESHCFEQEGFPILSEQNALSLAEYEYYTRPLLLRDTDQMSMAHSLEVRVPLMDADFIKAVMNYPASRRHPRYGRFPKQALVELIPELPATVYQRKKQGFVLPMKEWMKGSLRSYCKEALFDECLQSYFSLPKRQEMWNDFLSDRPTTSWSRVWFWVVLSRWMQNNNVQ